MTSNIGWSWSLRLVVALAVAAAIWATAATLALGALQGRVRASAPSALSASAATVSHR